MQSFGDHLLRIIIFGRAAPPHIQSGTDFLSPDMWFPNLRTGAFSAPVYPPSSYWTLVCIAILSLTIAWCDFYSSDQRFASTFLQISLTLIMVIAINRTPLVLAVSFPLLRQIRDFHPLETCAARRTIKIYPRGYLSIPLLLLIVNLMRLFTKKTVKLSPSISSYKRKFYSSIQWFIP